MKKARWVLILVVSLAAGALPGTATTATGTFLSLDSTPGDPLGGGIQQTFTTANATFRALSNGEDTFVYVSSPLAGWELRFAAPRGSGQLTPGTYADIARAPFRAWGQAGMDVISPAGGCNTISGQFTVAEATYGPYLPGVGYLRVISFEATFELYCGGASSPLTGHVRYEDPPDLTPPTISPLDDLTTEAEDATGTNVYYSYPYASDSIDPNPTLSCDPPYGARFLIGETTVTCIAADYSGNVAQVTFTVTVLPPLEYTLVIDRHGGVDTKTGVAMISGTIACSRPDSYAYVSFGEVVQRFANRAVVTGQFSAYEQFPCSPTPTRWTRIVTPLSGRFGGGKAEVTVYGAACFMRCFYFSPLREITLRAS